MQFPRSAIQLAAEEALKLPPHILKRLRYEWDLWALPHQIPPAFDDTWLQKGGRGAGKNAGVVQEIRKAVYAGVKRFNFIGRTSASVRDDMVTGQAGIIQAFPRHERPKYIISQGQVRFHTGAVALLLTAEKPEAIQGKNAEISWLDEFSTYGQNAEETWVQTVLATRVGNPRKFVTTNSMPDNAFLRKLVAEAAERHIVVTQPSSFDNFSNLPVGYQRQILEMCKTAIGRAWVTGEFFNPEGAIWKEKWFKYVREAPTGGRTVVAVDPSGTMRGDETGIVVARRVGSHGYVLEDLSGHHDAERWPKIVVDAAHRHRANMVVIERNRGLDFLRALIAPLDRRLQLKEITVTNRKDDRAYPIAHHYELGNVFHVDALRGRELEQQMCNWDPKSQETQRARRQAASPDRIDAAVHALHELGLHLQLPKYKALDFEGLPSSY